MTLRYGTVTTDSIATVAEIQQLQDLLLRPCSMWGWCTHVHTYIPLLRVQRPFITKLTSCQCAITCTFQILTLKSEHFPCIQESCVYMCVCVGGVRSDAVEEGEHLNDCIPEH